MLQILDRLTSIDSKLSHIDPDGSAGTKRKRSYAAEMGEDESPRYTKSPATSSSQKVEDIEYEQSDETTIPQSAVSEQMPPLETDFGQPLNHVPSGRSQSAVFGQDREENETLKPGQEEPAPGGIPADHTTSVEHLKTWSLINQFYVDSHHEDEPSVTAHEKMQGFLRIFGVGQTGDDIKKETAGQNESMAAPSPASDDSNPVDIGGLWGAGFNDGYLRLDEATLRRLEENYFKNFAILHPFLDRSRFKRMLIYFTKTYSNPTPGSSSSPPFEDTSSTSSSSRKSRNNYDIITWADFSKNFPSHKPIERTLNNAIVLLVLALGRMAEHREPLTGPVAPYTGTSAINYSPRSAPSPSTYTKASPATSHNTMSMTPSPNMSEARNYGMSRAPSHEGRPLLAGGKELRNIDVIPGLAYYGFATEIIHSFASAMDFGMGDPLLQVWAFLLAGLYMGQLARVMESFGWIDKACKAWLRLKDK